LAKAMATLKRATPSPPPPPPPGPLAFSGTQLVNDAAHPYQAPGPGDIRGPCPALNTLASHGVRIIFRASCFYLQPNYHSISIALV
jgi:hypothetical protein